MCSSIAIINVISLKKLMFLKLHKYYPIMYDNPVFPKVRYKKIRGIKKTIVDLPE